MRYTRVAWLLLLLAGAGSPLAVAQPAATPFKVEGEAIRAHMAFLADDRLEGREAGSQGEALATSYIVSHLSESGLAPGGLDGSYVQPVPLVQTKAADHGDFVFTAAGTSQSLLFGEDYLPVANFREKRKQVTGPVVYAGFGIVAPERGIDDFAGLDVRGKVVLVLSGAPRSLPGEERAYHASLKLKRQEAAKRGALALIVQHTPTAQTVSPFERMAGQWDKTLATWADTAGAPFDEGAPVLAMVSLSGGRKLFAGAPESFDQMMGAAEQGDGHTKGFILPITASIAVRSVISVARGSNIVGIVPGADPSLKDQFVVLTAHHDHLGMRRGSEGDGIYNGALDNAAGVATLLEMARGFARADRKPRRSLLFAFVTAEEKGLVGSDYFARNPTVPAASMVANLNVDMPILTYDFTDIVAFGAAHSSLGPLIARTAARMNIASSPDPVPDQAVFIRGDHFSFVQQGVPAAVIATGFAGAGAAAYADFLKHKYHRPGDDLSQSIDYGVGAKFATLVSAIAAAVADEAQRPGWNAGDFFAPEKRQ